MAQGKDRPIPSLSASTHSSRLPTPKLSPNSEHPVSASAPGLGGPPQFLLPLPPRGTLVGEGGPDSEGWAARWLLKVGPEVEACSGPQEDQ